MKNIKAEITGENDLIAQFVLQDAITGVKQIIQNSKLALFGVEEGNKYIMLAEVVGSSGQKYKLVLTGATKATYPTDEQTIDGGRDLLMVRITG
ncbi:hypothetical protein [Thalassotalea sp. G2M2-11]|uniref:hypothetical protein n=1 Tax=Thalassotalea sp. G2M2-11 TaxID=2787627 RepID=UPI0019D19480|nr:hypothetical protein [Thalassotalea sp. G2M2-11]